MTAALEKAVQVDLVLEAANQTQIQDQDLSLAKVPEDQDLILRVQATETGKDVNKLSNSNFV
jgi:hypothetical protein